jgi:hypothetical protein
MKSVGLITIVLCLAAGSAVAGEVSVVKAKAFKSGNNLYRFDVSLRHADSGWKHYADNWEVLTEKGTVLGKRVLFHPHVNEQPFTRSLGRVHIPAGIKVVIIRGHDKIHKNGGTELRLKLPGR